MSWLDRFLKQPREVQSDLFGNDQNLANYKRVDGTAVQKALQQEVQARGGSKKTHSLVNAIVTENVLGCTVDELYQVTGAKESDRSTLPDEAQTALMVGDAAAKYEIEKQDAQGHHQIVNAADTGSKKARKLFTW